MTQTEAVPITECSWYQDRVISQILVHSVDNVVSSLKDNSFKNLFCFREPVFTGRIRLTRFCKYLQSDSEQSEVLRIG